MNKNRFKGKGKAILGEKPGSLDEFLNDKIDSDMTASQHDNITDIRHDGMTEQVAPNIQRKGSDRTMREEFRCAPELADRLSTYVFEKKKISRSVTKTDVVVEALEGFLKQHGY